MIPLGKITIPLQLTSGEFEAPVCTKGDWQKLKICRSDTDFVNAARIIIKDRELPLYDSRLAVLAYVKSMELIRESSGLTIPWYPSEDVGKGIKYTVYTETDKLVADYANMSIYSVDEIPITEYWLIARDAFISKLEVTEKGREYLNNAYRLTQTEADEDIDLSKQ